MNNKIIRFIKNVGLYFGFAIFLALLGKVIYGVDETNTIQCPDSYVYFIVFFPILCVFAFRHRKKFTDIVNGVIHAKHTELPPMEPFTDASKKYVVDTIVYPTEAATTDIPAINFQDVLSRVDSMEGHDFEHWSADLLMKLGFQNVSVTPASGDHGVDVLAQKDGIKYAIQCKRYSHDLGNTPVQEVHAGKQMYGCQIGVVLTNKYFTPGAKQLADATGVLLWDRDWLIQKIQETANTAPQARRTDDDLYLDAVKFVLDYRTASVAAVQRRFKIGYAQAARLIDKMEADGYVGPFRGSTPREILK